MTRNFKKDGTTINGLILLSTIDQLKLLGIVGSDILKGFNVSEIKSEAWYPRTIRGQIHEAVKDRFGESGQSDEMLDLLEISSPFIADAVKRAINRK